MTRTEFIAAIQGELKDPNNNIFTSGQYGDMVDEAVALYSRMRPRKRRASFALVADQAAYDEKPADFMKHRESEWGRSRRQYSSTLHPKPWDTAYTQRDLPRFRLDADDIYLDPAPTSVQIASYGSTYPYWYDAAHAVVSDSTTVPVHDDPIVKLYVRWVAYTELATMTDQAEDFVVRYRKMADQVWNRLKLLLGAEPVLTR